MREISNVLSNIYICNKICKRGAKNQMREGDTILKIKLTLTNAKLKISLFATSCSRKRNILYQKVPLKELSSYKRNLIFSTDYS